MTPPSDAAMRAAKKVFDQYVDIGWDKDAIKEIARIIDESLAKSLREQEGRINHHKFLESLNLNLFLGGWA